MAGDVTLGDTMEGLRRILGEGPNLAYLSYITWRQGNRRTRALADPQGCVHRRSVAG